MLVSGMTHSGHTNSADVGHGFRLLAGSQAVKFVCLLAKIHLDDMGCLCIVVCFCFGCGWCLEGMLLSHLPSKLDALPSGKQLEMLGILLEEFPLHIWAQALHKPVQHVFVSNGW